MIKVIIYSLPTCGFCKQAKEYFDEKGVEYIDKDVSKDEAALKEMQEKSGGTSVPVIDINKKILIGFDQDKIDEALK
jgi:glutaredoxin 3